MRSLSILLAVAVAAAPLGANAIERGGGGFDMHNDVSAANGRYGAGAYNHNTGNAAAYNKNTGTATTYNKSTNTTTQYHTNGTSDTYHNNYNSGAYNNGNVYHPPSNSGAYNGYNSAGAYNHNTGNAAVYNKNTGNMTVYNKSTNTTTQYHYNNNGSNGYYYHGTVIANPVYVNAWGWNHGVVWAPYGAYWGGGFWGAFAIGAATAAVMGYVIYQNQKYTSYAVAPSSPGAILLSNYGLQQVPCGPPNLVVIYGPNFGIICANPNFRVAPGSYAVNTNTLSLQSQ